MKVKLNAHNEDGHPQVRFFDDKNIKRAIHIPATIQPSSNTFGKEKRLKNTSKMTIFSVPGGVT